MNNRGFSLASTLVSIALMAIIFTAISDVIFNTFKTYKRATVKNDQTSVDFLAFKQLSKSLVNFEPMMFRASRTFATNSSSQFVPLNALTDTYLDIDGSVVTHAIDDINVRNTIFSLSISEAKAEPETPLKDAISTILSGPDVQVYQDSFTLRNVDFKIEGSGVLSSTPRNIYISRCIPINKAILDDSGSTVVATAPYQSALYVNSLTNVPFLNKTTSGGKVRSYVSCCPINAPCTDDNSHQYFIKFYNISLNDGKVTAVIESPSSGESDSVYGVGFMIMMNDPAKPTLYEIARFSIRDRCKSLGRNVCKNLNPNYIQSNWTKSGFQAEMAKYASEYLTVEPMKIGGVVSQSLKAGVLKFAQ